MTGPRNRIFQIDNFPEIDYHIIMVFLRTKKTGLALCMTLCFFLSGMASSLAASPLRIDVAIRHHRFETAVREVPKGTPLLFRVTNFGKSVEEFESYDMAFEVVVRPGQTVEIPVSGLGTGRYDYFGDFHPRTARGTITVK